MLPILLFSIDILTNPRLPSRPLFAISIAPVCESLLLDKPKQLSFSLFFIIAEMKGAPFSSILFANKYNSFSSTCSSIEFLSYSRYSPFKLQLFNASDFKSFLFESALIKAIPPSPLSCRSLCVKNKSVNFVFDSRPSLNKSKASLLILL